VKILFHRLAVKPGRPLLFGVTVDNTFVFGLPGNPNSVLVSFKEYVLPVLRRLAAWPEPVWPADATAILTKPVRQKPGRQFNCTARLFYKEGALYADPIPGHGSGDYVSGANANGIIVIPKDSAGKDTGTEVPAHFWDLPLA
jgi:molybdopterin molybdotransferase